MSRYTRLDSDESRLPEGMERVGYDADTQIYIYRDSDGSFWEGEPGVQYGELHRSGTAAQPMTLAIEQAIERGDKEAWRYMLPFFLLMAVVLLLLFRYVGSSKSGPVLACENSLPYLVKSGESCWAIADARGATVEDLLKVNPSLDCDLLKAGERICVPIRK